jgi:curved DNA-binding protein
MSDYYQTLGLKPDATPDQIKKAYRSLAMKHHPDRGGDQSKFKDISVAYETLSDPQKKSEYDQMRSGGQQFRFRSGGFQDFNDIFGGMGGPFGDIFGRQIRKNRDLNIQCQISLLDSFNGKQIEANYTLPSGKPQTVIINSPPGISHGETIRYQGLGDDSVPNLPRGSLNVTIIVQPDQNYRRENDDLYTTVYVNPIEAIIGCRKQVKHLDGSDRDVDIRPGLESGIEYASANHGFRNPHTGRKGKFVIVVVIRTPKITDPHLIQKLKDLNNEINTRS